MHTTHALQLFYVITFHKMKMPCIPIEWFVNLLLGYVKVGTAAYGALTTSTIINNVF